MDLLTQIAEQLQRGEDEAVRQLVQQALAEGHAAGDVLGKGLLPGMDVVGEQFRVREIFLPEVLLAARAMQAGLKLLRPLLALDGVATAGTVVLGSVKGDLHDIGKNLVGIMLKGAGFEAQQQGRRELAWRADGQGLTFLEQESPPPAAPGDSGAGTGATAGAAQAAGGRGGRGAGAAEGPRRPDRLYQWLPPFDKASLKMLFESTTRMSGHRFSPDHKAVFFSERSGQNTVEYAVYLDEPAKRYSRKSLRVLGSVGEPINPEAWRWYYRVVGEERCAVVDTYWQTEKVQELLNATLWPGQPLGRPITGTGQRVDQLHRPELHGYLLQNYRPANTVIVAAGNLTHRETTRAVARLARGFKGGRGPSFVPADEAQATARVRLYTKKTEQTQLTLGIRTCSRHDTRRYAVRVLNTIL